MIPLNPNDPQTLITLLLIIVWTLPWKGVALWKAAKRGEPKWFIAILILNTFALLEIAYIYFFSREKKSVTTPSKSRAEMAILKTTDAELEDKLLDATKEWKKITLPTAASLLKTSEAEAVVILEKLHAEGRLRQIKNKQGEAIYYPK